MVAYAGVGPGLAASAMAASPAPASGVAASVPGAVSGHNVEGPPPGHTGGFGEPTCAVCHIGSEVNPPGSTLEVVGLGGEFEPGASYTLTIRLLSFDMYAAGFQAAIRYADGPSRGRSAGTFRAVDDRVRVVRSEAGVDYVSHTRLGTATSDDLAEWTVVWETPGEEVALSLDLAANSGNGDNSPLDDLVYAHSIELRPRTGR